MNLRLKEIRKAKGLTQEDLGQMIGQTKRVIGAWERQETEITLEDAVNLSNALGCTPNDLAGIPRACDSVSFSEDLKLQAIAADYLSMDDAGKAAAAAAVRGISAAAPFHDDTEDGMRG